jgi:thiol-disulfide isomerase/thioredoxin
MNRFLPRSWPGASDLGVFLLCCSLFTAGCGGRGSDEAEPESGRDAAGEAGPSADSYPPGPNAPRGTSESGTASDASSANERSSEFVLPPGEIPDSREDGDGEPVRGLEMPAEDNSASDTGSASRTPSATSAAEVRFATWDEIEQSARSSGQITVVDLWSLACPPCLKEFPGLVRLHEELGDRVRCIGVDLDFDGRQTRPPESYQPQVTEFLHSVDADFENYISQTPIDDVLAEVGAVSIPTVLIYDVEGNLVQQFVDSGETAGFTYDDDILPLIRQLAG